MVCQKKQNQAENKCEEWSVGWVVVMAVWGGTSKVENA